MDGTIMHETTMDASTIDATTMDANDARLDDVIHEANFAQITKQNHEEAMLRKEGHHKNVSYVQCGELWFATMCITSSILLAVFFYAVMYNWKLHKKRHVYDTVLFRQDHVQVVGLPSSEDEEEDEDEQMTAEDKGGTLAVLDHILPIWSCIAYIVCVLSLSPHCVLRVLCSYEKKLQDRMVMTVLQIYLSGMALIASTFLVFFFTRRNKAHPADTTCLSSTGKRLLYGIQREGIWGLHGVCTFLLVDDILVMNAINELAPDLKTGLTLTNLLYIWLGVFTLYIIVISLLDWWVNEDIIFLSYLLMLIMLCEIPLRNYKAMSEDSARTVTPTIGLAIFLCLSGRLVYVWVHKGFQSVRYLKFD